MLTNTQLIPTPKKPRPKKKPRQSDRAGEENNHNANNNEQASIETGHQPTGENANGAAAPASTAARSPRQPRAIRTNTATTEFTLTTLIQLTVLILRQGLRYILIISETHFKQINPSTISTQHFKAVLAKRCCLTTTRHSTKSLH